MSLLTILFSSPPPPPTFTPSSLLDLSSKVYLITSLTPTTHHLATTLYKLHATIYIGLSPHDQPTAQLTSITTQHPSSKGFLEPLIFNPSDPSSIKPALANLLENEWRLDVLFLSHADAKADFLIAKLLAPRMSTTASHFCHPNPSIRVVWISASPSSSTTETKYLLAHEFSKRKQVTEPEADAHAHTLPGSNPSGVQHVVVDATPLGSNVLRTMRQLVLGSKEDEYATCTLLYAGLAPEVRSGDWVVPWGRKGVVPENVRNVITAQEGDESVSTRMFGWYEAEVEQYM